MRYFQRGLVLTFLLAGCCVDLCQAQAVIDVAAHLKQAPNGHVILRFNLVNCGKKEISIELGNLPWSQTYTTLTAYVGVGVFARELPRVLMPADFPSHLVYLEPHESRQGEIDLNTAFRSLGAMRDHSELVVFWSYQLHTADVKAERMFGGMLTLAHPDNHPLCK